MKTNELLKLTPDALDLRSLGLAADAASVYLGRIADLSREFTARYDADNTRDVSLYSVGGRSEICGNHTDHNCGSVIAAAVNLDIIAVASARDDGFIRVKSEGFDEDCVLPSAVKSPDEALFGTAAAIIVGMEKAFLVNGYKIGGFDACTASNVLKGSGLSSSAAFEVMIGNILNHTYNGGIIDSVEIAKMAQFAENEYFGKPCGLMDQCACAVGGFIMIDFADPLSPVIDKLDFDLAAAGLAICIVNTGGSHVNLTPDYAAIPAEMKEVAKALGAKVLRGTTKVALISDVAALRNELGDRAVLRALHFFNEQARVMSAREALRYGDVDRFLAVLGECGKSSLEYLQNAYSVSDPMRQGLVLAIALSDEYLLGIRHSCRVHGGGFAGTVQIILDESYADGYKEYIEQIFGEGSCMRLNVRSTGAVKLI